MRGNTATKKQIEALEKGFGLTPSQGIIDVHQGFAIVVDRSVRKFTVLPPNTRLGYSPFHGDKARWTVNLAAAYRIAEEAAKEAKHEKPVPVIYREHHDSEYHYGLATASAGRIIVLNPKTGKKVESRYHLMHHWPGTEAQARKHIADCNAALATFKKVEGAIEKKRGRRVRYVDDLVLVLGKVKPTTYDKDA